MYGKTKEFSTAQYSTVQYLIYIIYFFWELFYVIYSVFTKTHYFFG